MIEIQAFVLANAVPLALGLLALQNVLMLSWFIYWKSQSKNRGW